MFSMRKQESLEECIHMLQKNLLSNVRKTNVIEK